MTLKKYNLLGALSFLILALFGFFMVNFFTALFMLIVSALLALFYFNYSKESEHKLAKFVGFVGFAGTLIMSLGMLIRILAVLFVSSSLYLAGDAVTLTACIVLSITFLMTAVRLLTSNRSDLVLVIASLLIIVLIIISLFVASGVMFFVTTLIYGLLLGYMFFNDTTI